MKTVNKREQVWQSLKDSEYRHQFVSEEIDVGIAFQLRSLRNRQSLTQAKLAELLKVKQPLLSAWENPSYGKYSLKTLKDLAKAFDVGLLVRFVPFSKLVDSTINLTSDIIAPPSFGEEQNQLTTQMFGQLNDTRNAADMDANRPLSPLVISQINSIQAGEELLDIPKQSKNETLNEGVYAHA